MSSYFDKLSEYYKSEQAEKDKTRFEKQVKNTFVSTFVIIGIVLFLIAVLVLYSVTRSVLG
ncbi:MAG TPA: hypothetical protein PK753_13680 [Ignavibacteria bacterium]|nr:hypothetical protein [Ignavibacteria bacterium]